MNKKTRDSVLLVVTTLLVIAAISTGVVLLLQPKVETVRVCSGEKCGVGFICADGEVTTAKHNVKGHVTVHYAGEILNAIEPPGAMSIKDVAKLQVGVSTFKTVKYCTAKVGSDVLVKVRESKSREQVYKTTVSEVVPGWTYYLEGVPVTYGFSGAPVIRKDGYCVIGIVVAMMHDGRAIVTAIAGEEDR